MPNTPQGKTISARNATTHGLFARDIVLPSLGEDPEGYRQIEAEWMTQLQPRDLLERHYVEKIAAASWRLRRLHRWQAQLFEDRTLTEDERLDRLDKVLRHETALHRQIDTAVKMLNKDVPQLAKSRARDQALLDTMKIETECRSNLESDLEVTFEAREWLKKATPTPPLDEARLDALLLPSDHPLPLAGEGLGVGASSQPAQKTIDEAMAGINRQMEEDCVASLAHDVSEVHSDGRPIYMSPSDWEFVLQERASGREAGAARYLASCRVSYLQDQEEGREILAARAADTSDVHAGEALLG